MVLAECWAQSLEEGDEWDFQGTGLPQHIRLFLRMTQAGKCECVKFLFSLQGNLKVKIRSQANLIPCGWSISLVGHLGGGRRWKTWARRVSSEAQHGCLWAGALPRLQESVTSAILASWYDWIWGLEPREGAANPLFPQPAQSIHGIPVCLLHSCIVTGQSNLHSLAPIPQRADLLIGLGDFPLGFWAESFMPGHPVADRANHWSSLMQRPG